MDDVAVVHVVVFACDTQFRAIGSRHGDLNEIVLLPLLLKLPFVLRFHLFLLGCELQLVISLSLLTFISTFPFLILGLSFLQFSFQF